MYQLYFASTGPLSTMLDFKGAYPKSCKNFHVSIFTFNKHFDKENDCVYEPVITKPHLWRRLFKTFYIVNFLLFKNETSTYLLK